MNNTLNYLLTLTPAQFRNFVELSGFACHIDFVTGKESGKNYCVIENTPISMPLGNNSPKPENQPDFDANYEIHVVTADMKAQTVPADVIPYLGYSVKVEVSQPDGSTKVIKQSDPRAKGFFFLVTKRTESPLVKRFTI